MGCAGDGGSSIPESRMPQRSQFCRLAGCPAGLFLLERLRCSSWVAPRSAPSGFAGDGAPSRLEPRILRRCRLAGRQVAPRASPSVSPTIRSAGRPASQIFRLRLVVSQVAPGPLTLRFCHWLDLQVAPNLSPLAGPAARFAGCPASLRCWPRRRTNFQVSLNFGSLGVASVPIGRLPYLSSPRLRCCFAGVSSASATAVGSMMNPWPVSNFASSVRAADESSRPIRSSFSLLTLHAFSIFAPLSAVGRLQIAELNRSRASCQVGSAVHFPTGSPTD